MIMEPAKRIRGLTLQVGDEWGFDMDQQEGRCRQRMGSAWISGQKKRERHGKVLDIGSAGH